MTQALKQKPLALACADWMQRRTENRTVKQSNFIHGNMNHVARSRQATAALVGSSNFTRRGVGLRQNPNIELKLVRLCLRMVELKFTKAET